MGEFLPMNDTYILLLRGVNVGRSNRIAMSDLRSALSDLGFLQVTTVLQSGNAVFRSSLPEEQLIGLVTKAIYEELDLGVGCVLRSHTDLIAALEIDPFDGIDFDPKRRLIGFMSSAPTPDRLDDLIRLSPQIDIKGDRWKLVGREIHILCEIDVQSSIFGSIDWQKILGVTVTMRNLNTASKVLLAAAAVSQSPKASLI